MPARASKPAEASGAKPRRDIPTNWSGPPLPVAPLATQHSSGGDPPSRIRPLKRCAAYQSRADKVPKAPRLGQFDRCHQRTDGLPQIGNAQLPTLTPAKALLIPDSTIPEIRTLIPTRPRVAAARRSLRGPDCAIMSCLALLHDLCCENFMQFQDIFMPQDFFGGVFLHVPECCKIIQHFALRTRIWTGQRSAFFQS